MYIHTGSSHLNPNEYQMSTIVGAGIELAEALEEQWRRRAEGVSEEVLEESSRGVEEGAQAELKWSLKAQKGI